MASLPSQTGMGLDSTFAAKYFSDQAHRSKSKVKKMSVHTSKYTCQKFFINTKLKPTNSTKCGAINAFTEGENLKLNILIAEDNPDHVELLKDSLSDAFQTDYRIWVFPLLSEAMEHLGKSPVDLFFCDLSLPDSPINETVQLLTSSEVDVPVIVLTSLSDTDLAKTLIQKGVQDYIPKEEIVPGVIFSCLHVCYGAKVSRDRKSTCYQ